MAVNELQNATGLIGTPLSYSTFIDGQVPADFKALSGAPYVPSFNEDPAIPAQCWIETGYGTQNACKYCHTNYLAREKHGNNFPIAEDQLRYSFPTPALNRIAWRNITHPEELVDRLSQQGIPVPDPEDPALLDYVRSDNWRSAYKRARANGDLSWSNDGLENHPLRLFPALDPNNLYPDQGSNSTEDGRHGYIDPQGFIRDRSNGFTGWRAVNFFPYAIFTPLSGSVSGIYLRLPKIFMTRKGKFSRSVYLENLELLEMNIKNRLAKAVSNYVGDAGQVKIRKGFYPVGTEFAHPLHYVDLSADGETGVSLDGLSGQAGSDYEFPGTRSKHVKEIRYLYKWKNVGIEDISDEAMKTETKRPWVIGREGQGWIDNKMGWLLAAYIENRAGQLRAQTTEELIQCLGCHSSVGNTIDSVWSFQRKLPGSKGWSEMDYGNYRSERKTATHLPDYINHNVELGEYQYFLYSVVGADLFGVMPAEIRDELIKYSKDNGLRQKLDLKHKLVDIFNDHRLKNIARAERETILKERSLIMRHYASQYAYLKKQAGSEGCFIKGTLFYPSQKTMQANIAGYRRIVLDQSFNLGKNIFGSQSDIIPFTFRSDGSVRNGNNEIIPVGRVIDSRPWNKKGVGYTPTGIVVLDRKGIPLTVKGTPGDIEKAPEQIAGHVANGGTFDPFYNPILSDQIVKP